MEVVVLLVVFFSCLIGSICGMGGGIIIKPVLDAFGIYSVSQINFLSSCTVLCMSAWSVGKIMIKKESQIDLKVSTWLAMGAALGGVLGKQMFALVQRILPDSVSSGMVQVLLFVLTLATFFYTLRKNSIHPLRVHGVIVPCILGLGLGFLGAFLGIGGGPFNVAALTLFFSMGMKTAAQNSLYIIIFSQSMGLIQTAVTGSFPTVPLSVLAGMVLCGILGSEAGRHLNRRLSEAGVSKLFETVMILIMGICVYNIFHLM